MPLFQESIVKKYLSTLNEEIIESAYLEFKKVYSPSKIKNIRTAKEEQYQEGFLKDVFGSVLGYSVYPEHPYNIETEKKNESNSKKADGAILKDDKVLGVIELKDNKTKNLDAVKDQAFGYKNNHKECSYVISSNFHKLRFYIDDATEYEEFDLYNLDRETFKRFYLYLRKEGLLDKNLPKLLRQETKFHEEEISKKLYKDYSSFKRSFFENALKNNPEHDKLLLFKKSQKFLDRVLFLLFAEDKGLVGTNSIVKIVEKWSQADDDYYRPLYELINVYFGHLYRGYKYQKTGEIIPQFGGELFAPDELLDNLKIDDDVLKNDLLVLSKYDFNTDVDVNILGHIFEHSLNEVDDVEAELRGETLDKSKSKRKKDGVFYTPKYITKYIVDNTLGKLCAEKKAELKLDQDIAIFDYQKADGKLNDKGKELFERLNAYKDWLLTLKVCDPACGSGAFLNQALSFFIEEHRFVDDIIAELTNTPLRLFDTDLQILENNIYGMDINEESIEIAKLSLWLRTAQSGRKLSDLSNNIKCGNSLIDDPAVAGDKAFCWEKEFPEVFANGGFDVVIGNPPYVVSKNFNSQENIYFEQKYKSALYQINLYLIFTELALTITRKNGLSSYIIPNTWLINQTLTEFRKYIIDNYLFDTLIDLTKAKVFQDATVLPIIFIIKNTQNIDFDLNILKYENGIFAYCNKLTKRDILNNNYFINYQSNEKFNLITDKISNDKISLGEISDVSFGVKFYQVNKGNPKQTRETVERKLYSHLYKYNDNCMMVLEGKDVNKYTLNFGGNWIEYGGWLAEPRTKDLFEGERILVRRIVDGTFRATYINGNFCNNSLLHTVKLKSIKFNTKFILGILNSRLMAFYFIKKFARDETTFPEIRVSELKQLPIAAISFYNQKNLIEKVDLMLSLNNDFQSQSQKLSNYISSQYQFEKLPTKLSNWYELSFSEFIQELNKAIKAVKGTALSKKDEFEWMELFEENKKKALELKSQIEQTDREIDRMVYALYGLTEEEIAIVENS